MHSNALTLLHFALYISPCFPSPILRQTTATTPSSYVKSLFNSEKIWPAAIVPYRFDDYLVQTKKHELILQVMNVIENVTCVRFKSVDSLKESNSTYLFLTTGDYCSSYVGRQKKFKMQNVTFTKSCLIERGIAHELIHALGFAHEQARFDRDNFVDIDWSNMQTEFEYTFEKEHDGHELLGYKVPYDYASVMHYGPDDFASNRQKRTLSSKIDPFYVRINWQLSFLDILKINLLYRCERELEIYSAMCVDYFDECWLLNRTIGDCKSDYAKRVCRKRCGLCS